MLTLLDHLRDLFQKHSDTLGNPFLREAIDTLARYEQPKMPEEPKHYQSDREGIMCEVGTGVELLTDDGFDAFIRIDDYNKLRTCLAAQKVRAEENEQDAKRYRLARNHIQPLYYAESLGTLPIPDLAKDEVIAERIDAMTDAALKEPKT